MCDQQQLLLFVLQKFSCRAATEVCSRIRLKTSSSDMEVQPVIINIVHFHFVLFFSTISKSFRVFCYFHSFYSLLFFLNFKVVCKSGLVSAALSTCCCCSGSREDESSCGRPLGIRVGPNGTLFVADAYLGVFEVNPTTGEAIRLVAGGQVVGGRQLSFINDVAVTQDGKKLYFTDSSSRWQRRDYLNLIMEATADGRYEAPVCSLRSLNSSKTVHVAGLNKGGMDTFMDNLPGFPDNIRPSSSGGYWVAMSAVRPNPGFSMLDFLSQRPWIKKLIFKLFSQEVLMKFVPRYSLVAELHDGGICTRSFHDPNGLVAAYISEVHEHDGSLYLGSFRSPYIAKLDLRQV
uniref:Uncharacterized protein n=1 Tax=Stegastes partitus TaxID=144197 RepID=A0A3B4ZU41_9TELE